MERVIRKAIDGDLLRILELIECGRQKMRASGNLDQWTDGNPRQELILQDIANGNSYIVEDDGEAVATFAFKTSPINAFMRVSGSMKRTIILSSTVWQANRGCMAY